MLGTVVVLAGCGATATTPATGTSSAARTTAPSQTRLSAKPPRLAVVTVGRLPNAASRRAAVSIGGGQVIVLGGLVGGSSSDEILAGPPGKLRRVGALPIPAQDDAAARLGNTVYLLGGWQASSSDAVVRVSAEGRATTAATLGEPLSDLGAAVVCRTTYIAGGYTGAAYATGASRSTEARRSSQRASRRPALRRHGLAQPTALSRRRRHHRWDERRSLPVRPRHRASSASRPLPEPVSHAPLVALGGSLHLIGAPAARRSGGSMPPDGSASQVGFRRRPRQRSRSGRRSTFSAETAATPC